MCPTVVVGLDGSVESEEAARWAAREAQRRGAVLDLVQILMPTPYPSVDTPAGGGAGGEWSERVVSAVEGEIVSAHPQLSTTRKVLSGKPSRVLTEITSGSDLMVLGSRGMGRVQGFLVGSVALPTVAHARCPVVLVRGDRSAPDTAGGSGVEGRVLLGVDVERAPEEVFSFAFHSAARRGVALHVLHCWEPPVDFGIRPVATPPILEAELYEERTRMLRGVLRPWQESFPGVGVESRVVVGSAGPQLVESAASASLVVVGRRVRRSPVGSHIGAVAHAVMHHSVTPVAVVPHA